MTARSHVSTESVKTTRLLTESEIRVLAQDSDTLSASLNEALAEQMLHTIIYWRTQCEMAGKELGDLRSLTIDEAPNASFVESYPELLADAKRLRGALSKAHEGVARYINAQGRHLYESWRDHLIECCDLERTQSGPYDAVRSRTP